MNLFTRVTLVLVAACLLAGAQSPAQASPITIENHIKRSEYVGSILSPNGKRLAALLPHKDRRNLAVIDLEKGTRSVITSFDTYDVINFSWVNNDRLMLRVGFLQTTVSAQEYKGTYAVDVDGGNLRNLSTIDGRYVAITPLRRLQGDTAGEFFVSMQLRRREATDVYRMNTRTGRATLLTFDSPANTVGWTLDSQNVPRLVTSETKNGEAALWYRSDERGAWRKLREWNGFDSASEEIAPIGFEPGKDTLLVSSNVGRNTSALVRFDPEQNKLLETIYEHPWVDVLPSNVLRSRKDERLLGVRLEADKPITHWFDNGFAALQAMIDAALPGKFNSFVTDYDEKQALVRSFSANDRGQSLLLNIEKKTMEDLPPFAPWIKAENIGERRFLWITARDGTKFPAWLSLPPNSTGKNLPVIVHIHGGPVLRSFGYEADPDTLFLASRGYAVLEPEPRGGTGFGRDLTRKGQGQWGRASQDDITDAALQLVKEGIADKSRMCLYGGSYGGYATLQGLVREPDLFKCGLATVAVTDLPLLVTDGTSDTNSGTFNPDGYYKLVIGDVAANKQRMIEASPAYNAERIKANVLLVMGSADQRVPIAHGDRMAAAMKKAGVKHEYVVFAGEGHGWSSKKYRKEFAERMQKFFADNIGGAVTDK